MNGISLVAGHWNKGENKLEVTREAKSIEEFPSIAVSVTKTVPSSKAFMLPLVKTLSLSGLSRNGIPSYTDGCPDNLVWYIPLACDQSQVSVVANSTCLVCSLPEQMET